MTPLTHSRRDEKGNFAANFSPDDYTEDIWEDAVGYDDAETLCLGFLEAILQLGHVSVGVTVANGLAQTHAVDCLLYTSRCV